MCWAGRLMGRLSKSNNLHALRRENGHFAVAEEENAARVREDRGNVAGDEKFLFAEAHHDRRPQARGDDFVGILGRKRHQRISAGHDFHGSQHGFLERSVL